ncbi:unnamed protein product [Albugo candida]|uniref:Uncharacterized protein n=1 Tax=Albugo candida TaxID=65357 RepID=A0A024G8L9_9STRA|nr:unnamed protein product [Albugo candida]|eukprot:CCI43103.1 unnamed protein product [Albugo candida]
MDSESIQSAMEESTRALAREDQNSRHSKRTSVNSIDSRSGGDFDSESEQPSQEFLATSTDNTDATNTEHTIENKQLSHCDINGNNKEDSKILILGTYEHEQCISLTEIIQKQVHDNFVQPNVLLSSNSPCTCIQFDDKVAFGLNAVLSYLWFCSANIDWNGVAELLEQLHNVKWHPSTCQKVWKYIAYGYEANEPVAEESDSRIHISSDSEAYEEQYTTNSVPTGKSKKHKHSDVDPADGTIPLFPTYDLPFDANDDEVCAVDKRLSLSFTASQFLRKKQSSGQHSTTNSSVTVDKTVSPHLSCTSSTSATDAHDTSKTTQSSQLTEIKATGPVKKLKMESQVKENTSSRNSTNLNSVHNFGTAPPPLPKPLMSSFQIYRKMYGNSESSKEISHNSILSETELGKMYAQAPSDVLSACASMAEEDRRRFDREHLRRSLWEKAYFSHQDSIN